MLRHKIGVESGRRAGGVSAAKGARPLWGVNGKKKTKRKELMEKASVPLHGKKENKKTSSEVGQHWYEKSFEFV